MPRIAVDLGEIFVPGVSVWHEENVEVIRYNVTGLTGYVYGVLEHRSPMQTAMIGFFDNEKEAIEHASKAL